MSVIPFPAAAPPDAMPELPRHVRIRGIEQCLAALANEAEELGLDLVARILAVAHETAKDYRTEALSP